MKYQHLKTSNFPDVQNASVAGVNNTFNYSRWTPNTKLKLCNVAWTSDYSHVPNFGTDKKRDDYFKALNGQNVEILSNINMTPQGVVKVPIPADSALLYNYLQVILPVQTGENTPLDYSSNDRIGIYYFFIQDIEPVAPNTTKLTLKLDVWTTHINHVKVENMTLTRGHYPVAKSNVDTYLNSPIDNSKYLLAQDVVYGEAENVRNTTTLNFNSKNDKMWACFHCSAWVAQVNGWGTYRNVTELDTNLADLQIPNANTYDIQGVPSTFTFAIEANSLFNFLNIADENVPQFKKTIKAMFFISDKLLSIPNTPSFSFCGASCYPLYENNKNFQLLKLNKDKFQFSDNAKKFAKLYTFPYSKIVINNENNEVAIVKIENIKGSELTVNIMCNLTISLSVSGIINGVNAPNGVEVVSINNVGGDERTISGDWYNRLVEWKIPTFSIVASARAGWDSDNYYSRATEKYSIDTSYSSAIDSADTGYSSAATGASAGLSNANASASTTEANNVLQVACNTAINNDSNRASTIDTTYSTELNKANEAYSAGYSRQTVATEAEAEKEKTAITSTASAASSIAGAVGSALSGNIAGAVGGIVNGAISGIQANMELAVATNLAQTKCEQGIGQNRTNMQNANTNASDKNKLQTEANTTRNNLVNQNNTAQTNNSTALIRANAQRSYNASITNAGNNRDVAKRNAERTRNIGYQSLTNKRKQGGYCEPNREYGINNPLDATIKPMLLQAQIITQTESAIEQTASEFAKFGYQLNQNIKFEKWSNMKRFDYWQVSDVWLTPTVGLNQSIQRELEEILKNGVTVWSDYENMKTGDIYDN